MSEVEAHVFRSYSLGAVDFIRTPVVPEILKAKVSVFVDLFKKTEQVKRQARADAAPAGARARVAAWRRRRTGWRRRPSATASSPSPSTCWASRTSPAPSRQLNPSWGKTLGFTDEELKSPLVPRVRPPRRPRGDRGAARVADATATPVPYFENRFATKAGGYRWLAWTAAPYTEEGLLYIYARDLTETPARGGGAGQAHPRADGPRGGRGVGAARRLPGRGGHGPRPRPSTTRRRWPSWSTSPCPRSATGRSSTWRRRAARSTAWRSPTPSRKTAPWRRRCGRRSRRWRAAARSRTCCAAGSRPARTSREALQASLGGPAARRCWRPSARAR